MATSEKDTHLCIGDREGFRVRGGLWSGGEKALSGPMQYLLASLSIPAIGMELNPLLSAQGSDTVPQTCWHGQDRTEGTEPAVDPTEGSKELKRTQLKDLTSSQRDPTSPGSYED
ncbi:hypothetical protein STEG23_010177 [Scotinomys teguina]